MRHNVGIKIVIHLLLKLSQHASGVRNDCGEVAKNTKTPLKPPAKKTIKDMHRTKIVGMEAHSRARQ